MSSLPPAGLLAGALCDGETVPALLGSKSCPKCHEIYSLLHHHIIQHHLADSEGRDTNILNNILLSILALLTTSNKLPEIPLASSTPPVDMSGTVTSKLQTPDSSSLMKTQIGNNNPLPPLRLLGTGSAVTSLTVPTIVNAGSPSHANVHHPVIMPKTDATTALKSLLADTQLPLKHVPQLSLPSFPSSQAQLKDQTSSLPSTPVQQSSSDALSLVREGLGTVPASQDLLAQFGHDNFTNLDVLMKLLRGGGQGNQNDPEGAGSSRANSVSENLSSPSLQLAKSIASTFPLLLGGQSGLTPDLMNMSTLQVAKQAEVPTSEKSDLDVADILVNKMPIPSISKGETGNALLDLHNLYLKQLSLQQNLFQTGQTRNSREDETVSQSEGKLDVSGIPLFSTGTQKDPLSQGLENIAQIVAAQKQLTSLLSLIGKTKIDKAMPNQSKPDLMETNLSNPLFVQASRGSAVTSIPTVCPIPLANLFSSPALHGKAGVIQTSGTSHGNSSLGFPTATTLSSLASLNMPSLLSSITSTAIPQLSLPISNPAGVPVSLSRSSSSSSFNRLESVISPRASTATKATTNLPSLAEHLFRTTTSRISTSDSPQLFNLASVVATTPVDANAQAASKLEGTKDTLPIGKGAGVSLLKLDGTDILSEAGLQGGSVDKIQGLINAARLTPQGSAGGLKALQKQASTEGGVGIQRGKTDKQDGLSGIQNVSPRENEKEKNSSKKLFKCDTCNVTFSVLSTLQAHEQIHLGTHMQCNYCYQVFTDSQEFQNHISLHRGQENVFHCQYCNRLFTSRGDLQKHLAEHTQKRPYKCSHCSKSFRDPGSLQKHERIHTGERPFHCTHCERAFAEYSSLRKHLRVHTGEQPYKCPHCPKAFSISGNLQRHLYIHTGERPYRCTKCPKAFNNPSHLRRHVKNLHDGKKSSSSRSHSIVKQESSEADGEGMKVDDLE